MKAKIKTVQFVYVRQCSKSFRNIIFLRRKQCLIMVVGPSVMLIHPGMVPIQGCTCCATIGDSDSSSDGVPSLAPSTSCTGQGWSGVVPATTTTTNNHTHTWRYNMYWFCLFLIISHCRRLQCTESPSALCWQITHNQLQLCIFQWMPIGSFT